ncbi:MAG: PhoH family protein, partial [Myxococcales bacterium]|nr:PhoH family protein [Myxococcales bacterium]
ESQGIRKMDLLILSAALSVKKQSPGRLVKLLSKDVNLRILADFEGILAEDYDQDRVSPQEMFPGYRRVEAGWAEAQRAFEPGGLRAEELGIHGLVPNEFVIFGGGERELVLRYDGPTGELRPVPKDFTRLAGINPRNLEQRMALDLLTDPAVQLVSLVGKAGTGKTFLALAAAMGQVRFSGQGGYERILLSKPVLPMGKDLGYLPGDFQEKMQPWMMSFFDNLDQLVPTERGASTSKGATREERAWEQLFATGQLEVQAIHSIRGRSIPSAFMLVDEAQNLTPHEVKTIITRAAEGTKVVLSGDPFQVDNPFLDAASNGLVYVTEAVKSSPMTGAVYFTKGERSALAELAATFL